MALQRRADLQLEATVPPSIHWSTDQVSCWVAKLGFPQYQDCFTRNFISGRKLILMDMSTLPKIGITDFEHMKTIAGAIRDLLGVEEPSYTRSISLPARDRLGSFLERKSQSGRTSNALTYVNFLKTTRNMFDDSGCP